MNLLALPLELTVTELKAEYAGCGSHEIKLTVEVSREDLVFLQTQITELLEKKGANK